MLMKPIERKKPRSVAGFFILRDDQESRPIERALLTIDWQEPPR